MLADMQHQVTLLQPSLSTWPHRAGQTYREGLGERPWSREYHSQSNHGGPVLIALGSLKAGKRVLITFSPFKVAALTGS